MSEKCQERTHARDKSSPFKRAAELRTNPEKIVEISAREEPDPKGPKSTRWKEIVPQQLVGLRCSQRFSSPANEATSQQPVCISRHVRCPEQSVSSGNVPNRWASVARLSSCAASNISLIGSRMQRRNASKFSSAIIAAPGSRMDLWRGAADHTSGNLIPATE